MIKKVVFFNFYHNGDLHVSRSLVSEVAKQCYQKDIVCEYFHQNNPDILIDVPYVKYTANNYGLHNITQSYVKDDTLYLNTWYGSNKDIFNGTGVSFDTLYRNFLEVTKPLDIKFDQVDPIEMFPSISYEKYEIEHARRWLENRTNRKKVFISNGQVLSGQFPNFAFSPVIKRLSTKYPDIDFLISNNENHLPNLPNVYMTKNIINKNGVDLNENSYLASHCDVIVGRFSGTYTFAMTRQNYWNPNKTFVVFTIPTVDSWIWTYKFTPVPTAKIVHYGFTDESEITNSIIKNLP
jgi:hypothetical protein